MNRLLLLVIVVGGAVFIVGNHISKSQVTFDLSAETGKVEYTPLLSPLRVYPWSLDSIQIYSGVLLDSMSPAPRKPVPLRTVSGTLQFIHPVNVVVTRASWGPLLIELNALANSNDWLGVFEIDREGGDADSIFLSHGTRIIVPDIASRAIRGQPVLLPVEGYLVVGSGALPTGSGPRPTTAPDSATLRMAGLRTGNVALLTNSALTSLPVLGIRSVELRPGDTFLMTDITSSGIGLLAIDERPSINVAYRTTGLEATIRRLHPSPRPVRVSLSEAWLNDPFIQSFVSFILVCTTLASDTAQRVYREWPKLLRTIWGKPSGRR